MIKTKKIKSDFSPLARAKRWVFLLLPCRLSVFIFRKFIDNDPERNSLAAAKFLTDANKIYHTKNYMLLPRFLKFSISLANTDIPRQYTKFLSESLMHTRRNPSSRSEVCQRVLQKTQELAHDQCDAHGWKIISLALSGFGFIRAGTIARNNCLEASLNEVKSGRASNRTLHLAIRGLLESRRFDEARTCMKSNAEQLEINSTHRVYMNYLLVLKQSPPKLEISISITETPEEHLYKNLVKQKSIALVATGEILSRSGLEIDSHDTVARVKFRGREVMPAEEFAGSRCDITTYTEELFESFTQKSLSDSSRLNFLDNVQLLVLKGKTLIKLKQIPCIKMADWAPTFLTTATSGTLFLFDLLIQSPKKLNLYGFNFYTNNQLYNSEFLKFFNSGAFKDVGLPKNWLDMSTSQRNSSIIARGFTAHDPKSDFLLIKNLYELSGLIDGTPEVLEILNLTANEYDLRLETMLGDW